MPDLTHFERRRIQMEYAVPLIKGLQQILGETAVNDALDRLNKQRQAEAATTRTPDFSRMAEGTRMFAEGGALNYKVIASESDAFDMNVHGCRYAEMMEELGGRAFGHLLVCNQDFAAASKIGMTLTRTQTRMQGADYCDFRYRPADPKTNAENG